MSPPQGELLDNRTLASARGLFGTTSSALAERVDAAHDAYITDRVPGAAWARDKITNLATEPAGR